MERNRIIDYCDFKDIPMNGSAIVLDTSAFNDFKGEKSIVDRLEKDAEMRKKGETHRDASLEGDIVMEGLYLSQLAEDIRNKFNYYVPEGVVKELKDYYKKISKTRSTVCNIRSGASFIAPFIGGVADVICASELYSVHRVNEIIGKRKPLFDKYFRWVMDPPLSQEGEKFLSDLSDRSSNFEEYDRELYGSQDSIEDYIEDEGQIRPRMEKSKKISDTDAGLLALSLCLAWEKPTILLTGDTKHVGDGAKGIYGFFDPEYYLSPSGLPQYPLQVFVGFPEGWNLWMDSKESPILRGERSWSDSLNNKLDIPKRRIY